VKRRSHGLEISKDISDRSPEMVVVSVRHRLQLGFSRFQDRSGSQWGSISVNWDSRDWLVFY
jgi:hypothetical protein